MKSYLSFLFGVLFLLSCSHEMPVEKNGENQLPQWPMFGKNLRHTSNASDPVEYYRGPQQGVIVWTWNTSELITCSPSIGTDGTIYIASSLGDCSADSGFIYAFNPNGTIKWRFRTESSNFGTGALGQDGSYYYGSLRYLYAIDQDGRLKWKRQAGSFENEARPAISKTGEIIFAERTGVTALDPETGNTLWVYSSPTQRGSRLSIDYDGTIYSRTSNSVLALSSTGSRKWEYPLSRQPQEVMIGNDGTLYFQVVKDSLLYALNPDGSLKWTYNFPGRTEENSPALDADGNIYLIFDGDFPEANKLLKLNPRGTVEWEVEIGQLLGIGEGGFFDYTIPIIDKDMSIYAVISLTGNGNLHAINQNRQLKWSVTIENPAVAILPKPAIAPDGTLYVAGDHTLNAIK